MNPIGWIVLLVVAVVIVGVVAWSLGQRRRSQRLQERFGPEYERTVESTGKRSDAEAELEARQERVEALDIRPLSPEDRDRFRERWRVVQAMFVDDPASAVGDADTLIGEVMRARGYPVGDFEQRAADISVDHPHVVDHYRTAHQIALRQRTGEADTEQLRQAMVHDRALFADLLDLPGASEATTPTADAVTAPTDGTGATTGTSPAATSTAATSTAATSASSAATSAPPTAPPTSPPDTSAVDATSPIATTRRSTGEPVTTDTPRSTR